MTSNSTRHIPSFPFGGLILFGLVATCVLPQVFLGYEAFFVDKPSLYREAPQVIWGLLETTLSVCVIASLTALLCGGLSAWCVARYEFPLRRLVSVLLCLPFAVPGYILAATYVSLYQSHPGWIPPIETIWGAGVLLGLSAFPWVYLPLRAQLEGLSSRYDDLALTMPLSPWQRFWRLTWGFIKPVLGIGCLLVWLEAISDFGLVNVLGVKTLSVGIHDAMFSMYRRDWAAQLSLTGWGIPVIAVCLFAWLMRTGQVHNPINQSVAIKRTTVSTGMTIAILLGMGALLLVSLLLPIGMLCVWSIEYFAKISLRALPGQVVDTVVITLSTVVITVLLALISAMVLRRVSGRWRAVGYLGVGLVNLNFALPSIMLGIAMLVMSSGVGIDWFDELLSNTVWLIVLGSCVRFLCFPLFCMQAGLATVPSALDELCHLLNLRWWRQWTAVYWPSVRRFVACGVILVLVNMVKELPISTVLQPFGFQSLSMRVHTFAGVGMLEESAMYSLALIALVIYPVLRLNHWLGGSKELRRA